MASSQSSAWPLGQPRTFNAFNTMVTVFTGTGPIAVNKTAEEALATNLYLDISLTYEVFQQAQVPLLGP